MAPVVITLIGKPDCHLCDNALAIVTEVIAGFENIELQQASILDDPELFELYVEEIPVVLINGRVHTIWRVDPARLRTAVEQAQQ